MRAICLGLLGFALLLGCGEDETPGALYDRCQQTATCDEGLTCVLGRCTRSCNNVSSMGDEKCAEIGAICAGSGCFPECTGGSPCQKGLECYVTSRAQVHACQPPEDEIVHNVDPAGSNFGNADASMRFTTVDAGTP